MTSQLDAIVGGGLEMDKRLKVSHCGFSLLADRIIA
jgi:hypothetical protein